MVLYMVGAGLEEKGISLQGLDTLKKCKKIYVDNYTSVVLDISKLTENKVILANRDLVENKVEDTILKDAQNEDIAFVVGGDVFSATTHTDLLLRAKKLGIKIIIIHGSSIISAIGITGIQVYNFGKTTSIPFKEKGYSETCYDSIKLNLNNNLHSLILLDLDPENNKFMTIKEAIDILLDIETKRKEGIITENTKIIGCARIGDNPLIKYGKIKDISNLDFGESPYCLVIPAKKLHFMEEEALEQYEI